MKGIELLASQNSATPPDQALQELQILIEAAEDFHQPRSLFEDSVMPETKALVTQVKYLKEFEQSKTNIIRIFDFERTKNKFFCLYRFCRE